MKAAWRHGVHADSLIVFCSGWGMDESPFCFLEPGAHDVCMLYDYRNITLPPTLNERLSDYRSRYLVCWSMGVWAGQELFFLNQNQFVRRIALNGTLLPISDYYGIPVSIYDKTLASFDDNGRQRFYRRMCREPGVLRKFLKVKPRRQVCDQKEELICLRDMVSKTGHKASIYTDIIMSDNDLVIPTVNQRAHWQQHESVVSITGCHFPFFRWRGWDELLDVVMTND